MAAEHDRRYAPGHLGELTRLLPIEMVDEAVQQTRTLQKRLRGLPARVVVYLLLAGCLFPEVGYPGVWRKLTAGLAHLAPVRPSASALCQARRRIGPAPLKWLFDLIRGPEGAAPARAGVWWKGLLVTAIDGTILTVPDQPAVRTRYVKQAGHHGGTGYPQVRLLALLTCGTRTLIDAVFAPTTVGETTLAPGLWSSLRAGMLVLADRNFDAVDVLTGIAQCDADFLIRGKTSRRLPVLARHQDESFTSRIGPLTVRVIDAQITVTTADGEQRCAYRLLTTLMDPVRYPAHQLVGLYHERWEIETAYLELKASILGGRVLRARTAPGLEQEIYALLVTYQLIRTAISDAAYATGMDPDRGSFTIAWQTAKDQVVLAQHAIDDAAVELVGVIGAEVLADPLPPRRLRVCPRIVKRAISKYQARGPVIDRSCRQARLDVYVLPGEPP
ncbi:IS4 family transposase [Leekyejoonella antrihumi]|uniref:IS4 family transposase n=1 Tax=Leekyejoonella antrihumi TaxID=1660198 RepID=A0A563DPF1_9MICO|nr:IS4 family transposase [Leekyejoonella antrihumi]